jgi:hypothetical protein
LFALLSELRNHSEVSYWNLTSGKTPCSNLPPKGKLGLQRYVTPPMGQICLKFTQFTQFTLGKLGKMGKITAYKEGGLVNWENGKMGKLGQITSNLNLGFSLTYMRDIVIVFHLINAPQTVKMPHAKLELQ